MSEKKRLATFEEWLQHYFPGYVDKQAKEIVNQFGMWAWRSERFEVPALGRYLDKGILLTGPVGTGKTDLFRLLQKYLMYLQSPYRYSQAVVWEFAPKYREDGESIFYRVKNGNWYFDELGLTNEQDLVPYKEIVNDFGNRAFVGAHLIMMRYNIFKNYGYQTHFSTNLTPKQLQIVYGQRCFSRLAEMCNFMDYGGKDRRITIKPKFHSNENNYEPANQQLSKDQIDLESKEFLNGKYMHFFETGELPHMTGTEFEFLKSFEIEVATDGELHDIKFDVEETRKLEVSKMANPINKDERRRMQELKMMYQKNELDRDEQMEIWFRVKKIAVKRFFENLKTEGRDKIFLI